MGKFRFHATSFTLFSSGANEVGQHQQGDAFFRINRRRKITRPQIFMSPLSVLARHTLKTKLITVIDADLGGLPNFSVSGNSFHIVHSKFSASV